MRYDNRELQDVEPKNKKRKPSRIASNYISTHHFYNCKLQECKKYGFSKNMYFVLFSRLPRWHCSFHLTHLTLSVWFRYPLAMDLSDSHWNPNFSQNSLLSVCLEWLCHHPAVSAQSPVLPRFVIQISWGVEASSHLWSSLWHSLI